MGTRGLTCVVLDGEFKVAQYGQWDHYPSGQGAEVARIMQQIYDSGELDKFKQAVRECTYIPREEVGELFEQLSLDKGEEHTGGLVPMEIHNEFSEKYPEFSRDTGAQILDLIHNKGARKMVDDSAFAADSLFCEWAYVVDLDTDTIEVYQGFNKGPAVGRFAHLVREGEQYTTVTLYHSFPIESAEAGMNEAIEKYNDEGDDD